MAFVMKQERSLLSKLSEVCERNLVAVTRNITVKLQRRRCIVALQNELATYSDTELNDIGLSRADIPAIAKEHAINSIPG